MPSDELAPALRILAERYEILGEIGRGGMATVFLARELATNRRVAIKTIDARHADDAEARARFAREARTVAALDHRNIVRMLSVERLAEGVAAIVMEYVPGGTLRATLLAEGPFSFERTERILRDVAEGLRYAHALGLVHRDVKPENVFLDATTGRALLSDFGIARAVEEENPLTLTGTSIGTPTYMSPEQIDGRTLDGRTDIYSLGLVGWEMLAGARPWDGESLYKVIYKQKHEELPRLALLRPDIPEHLLFAIEGALHKDRETRWANLDEFLAQLDEPEPAVAAAPPLAPAPAREPLAGAAPLGLAAPVAEDEWSPVYVPGTPEEEARRDAEALGRSPGRDWGARLKALPLPARPGRLVVPLALAVVAAIAVVGGRRSRPASPPAPPDSVTRAISAGELDAASAPPAAARAPTARSSAPAAAPPGTAPSTAPSAAPRSNVSPPASRPRSTRSGPRASAAAPRTGGTARVRARTHGDSLALCRSSAPGDQQACLGAALADRDRGLNNVYRTLIGEMRKQARVPVGAPDPPGVERLRAQQRAWLETRDAACRRETSGSEGALWALTRVRCLGREGVVRSAVLADRLTRLRAP